MVKWLAVGAAAVIALAIGGIAALPFVIDTPIVRAHVVQAATHALGRPITYSALTFSAFPLPAVRLKGLQVAEDPAFGSSPFLTVAEGIIRIRLHPLLAGRVELSQLVLDSPDITLIEDAKGRLNISSLGASSRSIASSRSGGVSTGAGGLSSPVFSSVRVVNGSVKYVRAGNQTAAFRLERINGRMKQGAPGEPWRLSGEAMGQPGDVRVALKDASVTGGLSSPADMPLKGTIEIEAADVGPIGATFVASPTISGAMRGRLEVAGTLARLAATGEVNLERATVSEIRPQCGEPAKRELVLEAVRMPLTASPPRFESPAVAASVARGTVTFRLEVSALPPVTATLHDIAITGMELRPVLVDFLCQPYAVTGPLELHGNATLRLAEGWRGAAGSGRIRVGPGRVVGRDIVNLVRDVVGLGTSLVAFARPDRPLPSPLEFESIAASYTIKSGVARTDDLLYRSRDLRVRAAGTCDLSDGRVAMEVTLSEGAVQVSGFVSGGPGSLRVAPMGTKVEAPKQIKRFLDRLFR